MGERGEGGRGGRVGGWMGTPNKENTNKKQLRKQNEVRRVGKQLLLPAFLVTQFSRLPYFSPSFFFAEGVVSVVKIITVTQFFQKCHFSLGLIALYSY